MGLLFSEWERTLQKKFTRIIGMLFPIMLIMFIFTLDTGQYNYSQKVAINSLNFRVFLLSKFFFVINMIIIPILSIDSINREYVSGSLRLVAIRPVKIINILFSKWIVWIGVILSLVFVIWLAGIVGSKFVPQVDFTTFYFEKASNFNGQAAFMYEIKYYIFIALIMIASLGISSLISMLCPNAVIAYTVYFVGVMALMYIKAEFMFFTVGDKMLFEYLHTGQELRVLVFLVTIIIISYLSSLLVWYKRSWLR
ncbi:ABC-2 family transporter protein [Bacillus cereus]|nr:ABC-2 family transporter protein [Bacillus cereus]